jgi:hypothetical protein
MTTVPGCPSGIPQVSWPQFAPELGPFLFGIAAVRAAERSGHRSLAGRLRAQNFNLAVVDMLDDLSEIVHVEPSRADRAFDVVIGVGSSDRGMGNDGTTLVRFGSLVKLGPKQKPGLSAGLKCKCRKVTVWRRYRDRP